MNAQTYTVTFVKADGRRDWFGGDLWIPVITDDMPPALQAKLILVQPNGLTADDIAVLQEMTFRYGLDKGVAT